MAKTKCEIFIAMNEDGDWVVASDPDDASEILERDVGGHMCRIVNITAWMTAPQIKKAEVEVSDEAGEITAQAAE